MIKYVYLSLIAVMLGASLSWGDTNVIGFISTDTTWTQVGSPYTLMGKVIVKEGATFTIEPGVMVQIGSEYPLVIEGTGRISTVKNNGNGTYTATYTASNQVDNETILVAAPNNRLVKSAMVTLTALTAGTKKTATESKDTTASTVGLNSRWLPWVIVLATLFLVAIIGVLIYQKRRKSST